MKIDGATELPSFRIGKKLKVWKMIFENVCRNPANCQIHGQKTMQETFR